MANSHQYAAIKKVAGHKKTDPQCRSFSKRIKEKKMEAYNNFSFGSNHRPQKFSGNFHRIVFWGIIAIAIAVLFALVFGLLVKWLWAATLTPLFNIPELTYWQAVGIIVLARLVFGGFGRNGRSYHDRYFTAESRFRERSSLFRKLHDRFHGWDDDIDAESSASKDSGKIQKKIPGILGKGGETCL